MTTPTTVTSTNWSGAVMTAPSGESFSTISAVWKVPTVSQIEGAKVSDAASWVGIDGYNSADVCQAGVQETVHTLANGHTAITCSVWDEWYPAASHTIPASSFKVEPGDTIKVTVDTSGAGATEATFIFDNETTGQVYDTSLTAPRGTSLEGNSAEVVVETPEWGSSGHASQPILSDFVGSPVVFQDVDATYAGGALASLSSAESIGMWTNEVPGLNGSYVQEAYGSIQTASDSVTVTENDYWPDDPSPSNNWFGHDYYF